MPRGLDFDQPGLIHPVMARGIERRCIFLDDENRRRLLRRLEAVLAATNARCSPSPSCPTIITSFFSLGLFPSAASSTALVPRTAQNREAPSPSVSLATAPFPRTIPGFP